MSWQIQRIETQGRVIVSNAGGAPPNVPFWRGEGTARTHELSSYVAELRQKISDFIQLAEIPQAKLWLKQYTEMDEAAASQLIDYIRQGEAALGAVPTQKTIIAERFFDEGGGMQLIIHAPFGARINKAWGLALRKKFCRSFNFELQAAATDDGLNISLAEQHSFPLADVFHFLHPNTVKETLIQAVMASPLFTTRWRWVGTRALALQRFQRGKKTPPHIMRILADDLLAAVFPDAAACQDNLAGRDIELPDHPLIAETMKDVLQEALNIQGLIDLLGNILSGKIKCVAIDTPTPSPFAHQILNANPYAFLDDAPLEERRARAVEMRRILPDAALQAGRLDPQAIETVQNQAWPDVRNADEVHDALQTLIVFPEEQSHHIFPQSFLVELEQHKRARVFVYQEKRFWVAAEKISIFLAIYQEKDSAEHFAGLKQVVQGWLLHTGPVTSAELSIWLSLNQQEIDQALLQLESSGMLLRGRFVQKNPEIAEWCERRLLARIHRLTVGALRQEIIPMTTVEYMQWLLQWQHVAPGAQLRGENGLIEIIKQLQGFELPANAWEKQIFSKRVADYDSSLLDRLCLSGVIGWGRISTHPALLTEDTRIMPTRIAPITFFVREDNEWLLSRKENEWKNDASNLSAIAQKILFYLQQKGAAFFSDIVRGVGGVAAEIENGLWELVAAGCVSADSFDNLRALINPARRNGKERRFSARPRFSTGRWSLMVFNIEENRQVHVEKIAWLLLKRYGVVFRDILARESIVPRWRDLLIVLRRLEDQGEVRAGRFCGQLCRRAIRFALCCRIIADFPEKTQGRKLNDYFCRGPFKFSRHHFPWKSHPCTFRKKTRNPQRYPYTITVLTSIFPRVAFE